ncbi:MAG: sulfite exporter TauE/SafE family protein [Chloroflexi bacterium]|nr:sulfite exporter TauE/SafE family protein [Chloroflexota bacterium]
MSLDAIFIMALATLMIGLSKGGLGGPVPISLIAPLLSQIMPVPQAVGITLPLLLFADIFALRTYWGTWDKRYIRLMLPIAVLGVVMGTWVLATLPDLALRRVLGVFTLSAVLYKIASGSLKALAYSPRDWHAYVAGWASGFGSAVANVGAPPFTAYMLLQKIDPTPFIGTTTLFFAVVNALKLPGFLLAGTIDVHQLIGVAWTLPIIPFGVWLGRKALQWINPRLFEWLMLSLLLWASLTLIFSVPPVR